MQGVLEQYEFLGDVEFSQKLTVGWDGVVIHYTAGGKGRATAEWGKGVTGGSWHFLGNREGKFIQQVPLIYEAWHAGRSEWPHSSGETLSGANHYAVGIELANHGPLEKVGDKFFYEVSGRMRGYAGLDPIYAELVFDTGYSIESWWEPYPEEQIAGLELLLSRLEGEAVPRRLFGHEEVAMPFSARKIDPGPLFPWERFGRADGRRTRAIVRSK